MPCPFQTIEFIQLNLQGRRIAPHRIRRIITTKKPTLAQDKLLLIAECSRVGMPENLGFTLDKSFTDLHTLWRETPAGVATYDTRVTGALNRAARFVTPAEYLTDGVDADSRGLIVLAEYLYELRGQTYAGK